MYAHQHAAKEEDEKIQLLSLTCNMVHFYLRKNRSYPEQKYVQSSRFVATNRIFMIQVKSSRRGEARIIGSICEDVLYSI